MDRAELVGRVAAGEAFKYLFFWGHVPKVAGRVDASCLSQWYPAEFVVEPSGPGANEPGVSYATAEHFMMAEKARLFGDASALSRVLSARSPAEAKAVGREVVGYVDDVWSKARFDAVVRGNVAKFSASPELRTFLLETGGRILVEAAPRDTIWGIGLGRDHPRASDPSGWRGQNLLGFALMEVRERLRRVG